MIIIKLYLNKLTLSILIQLWPLKAFVLAIFGKCLPYTFDGTCWEWHPNLLSEDSPTPSNKLPICCISCKDGTKKKLVHFAKDIV